MWCVMSGAADIAKIEGAIITTFWSLKLAFILCLNI